MQIGRSNYWVFLIGLLLWCSCETPAPPAQVGKMVLMPIDYTGIDFANQLEDTETFNILNYLYYYNGGGVAIADFDRDSLPDIFFTANLLPNRLYRNEGAFRFADISQQAGIEGPSNSWSTGVSIADVNQDGWPDIYVSQLGDYLDKKGHNLLYLNQGDLTFREAAAEYNLDLVGFSTQAVFFDYDRDGDLDMFQLNHSIRPSETVGDVRQRDRSDPLAGDKLLRNDNGKYVDITQEAGISSSRLGYGLNVVVGDINGDDWPDIYICNDFHEDDYLYLNHGDGRFTESLKSVIGHTSRFSMGSDLVDINHDGRLDILSLDMKPEREDILKTSEPPEAYDVYQFKRSFGYHHQFPHNALQLNLGTALDGKPRFAEIAQYAGIEATDWSWSALFADFDNDAIEDLYITNGIYRRPNDMDYIKFISDPAVARQLQGEPSAEDLKFIEKMPSIKLPNYLYKQSTALQFENVGAQIGMEQAAFSNGSAYADLDRDGDLDLVVNNINQSAFVYRNDLAQGNYLRVQVANEKGPIIGTKVDIWADSTHWYRELYPVRGFQSSMEAVLHFGMGSRMEIDSILIRFPDGRSQSIQAVQSNQTLYIDDTEAEPMRSAKQADQEVVFAEGRDLLQQVYQHIENKDIRSGGFNDFRQEVLIPHMLSTEGPALATADVNLDGREDFYVGGAKDQPGVLYLQQKDGSFAIGGSSPWLKDRAYEDVDAVFFDANGDSWPDLYVVSGGNEFSPQDKRNQDRLYLNQKGKGFERAPEASLPDMTENGACVAVADWDGDDDLDIFVGNRSVAGQYGVFPPAFWLENDGAGRFRKVDMSDIPLKGMITDAVFEDFEGDGDMDLWLVGEWMPITLLENKNNRFELKKIEAFQNTEGWWNRMAHADFDGDGDQDFIVGNLGLNSTVQANEDEPCTLYLADFDQNGVLDPIICAFNEGVSYPMASKDEITQQIIALRRPYERYADYAQSTIVDLFGPEAVDAAIKRKAICFSSVYIENLGEGHFRVLPLPEEVQFAPIYAIQPIDVNQDGKMDVVVGGNFSGVGPGRGRYDATYGWYLQGNGDGTFDLQWPSESGLWLEGESRRLGLLARPEQTPLLLLGRNNGPIGIWSNP
ncbi:MAG: VCBS repeat-containing protein [Bacteroidia bacterium]